MVDIITSEAKARQIQTAVGADIDTVLNFAIPVGDAIVINGVELTIADGSPTQVAVAEAAGTVILALTSDAAPGDFVALGEGSAFAADPGGGAGAFLYADYSMIIDPMEATETGTISMQSLQYAWDWRAMDVDRRPLTTEIMNFIVAISTVGINMDMAMTIAFQRVRLTKGDLGLLQPGTRIIRIPEVPAVGVSGRVGRIL